MLTNKSWLAAAAGLTLALAAHADDQTDLKVSRVAIFSSGVAFYERTGTVNGDFTAELSFRTEQINDILKSLVVQDFDGGAVSVVRYASRDPISKTLRSFGVDITGKPTLAELLDQLRGQAVEISGARKLQGVIVGVEERQLVVDDKLVKTPMVNILAEAGLTQVAVSEIQSIRLANDKVDAELRKALGTLALAHDADKKSVEIHFEGAGQRRVRAAYLLEAPIWKTSYRLVLNSEKKPFLQGWATVENATEEDWRDVKLSLVSGRPISFTMDLYTPLYVPRPKEELELYASLRAPDYASAVEKAEQDDRASTFVGRRMAKAAAPPPAPESAERFRAMGYADAAAGEPLSPGQGVASAAEGAAAGELFEYAIQTPVSIPRQHSAMLPIVNQEVTGEKVSIYNPATHATHPLNGLQLTNTTGLHLMQGPVTLFEGGVYAGDAKLPDMKPGEQRLIAYALDLAVDVMVKQQPRPDEIVALKIVNGTLVHTHRYVDSREYVVKNKDSKPRVVMIEQPYGDEWTLTDPPKPAERAPGLSRFRLEVPAGQNATQVVTIQQTTDQSIALIDLHVDVLRFYLRARVITPKVREALETLVRLRTQLAEIERSRQTREQEVNEAVQEQARVRENLKTLQKDSDAYRRQEKKFDELETRIESLRTDLAGVRASESAKRAELEHAISGLSVE